MTDPTNLQQAEAALAAVERAVRDGDMSPVALGAAQARVALASLRDPGVRDRQRADLKHIRAESARVAKLARGQLRSRPDHSG